MTRNSDRFGNHLLDALIDPLKEFLSERMGNVSLGLKDVCYEANKPIRDIYFPTKGVISWVQNTGDGKSVEVATVGNEGFVGVPVLLGADRTPGTSFTQIPGAAIKINSKDFCESLASFPEFLRILQRYVQALLVQIAQGNACNSTHPVEQRCARWLLTSHDRVGQPSFFLTQDF